MSSVDQTRADLEQQHEEVIIAMKQDYDNQINQQQQLINVSINIPGHRHLYYPKVYLDQKVPENIIHKGKHMNLSYSIPDNEDFPRYY